MANSWRVAKSLSKLRDQFDELAPDRATDSDGTIGNEEHASRASDHNPDRDGMVKALDITHDPAHGVDTYDIADQLLKTHDERINYIISNHRIGGDQDFYERNKRIYDLPGPWQWGRYHGANPHDHHFHISVDKDGPGYDDTTPWRFHLAEPTGEVTPHSPVLRRGSKGERVKYLQGILGIETDGNFGPKTEAAVRQFQKDHGLVVDGVVGAYTWRELLKGQPEETPPRFHAQVPGGYFSSTPFDTSINTSIRTNNPGALNVAGWVKELPGYVGDKVTSWSGASPNSTVIFETPEDGVAAWWKLLDRYKAAGATTVQQIIDRYGGAGQDYSEYVKFVVKRSGLGRNDRVDLKDDSKLLNFAKAMFRYEAGQATPLSDDQIRYGFQLARGEVARA